MNENKIDKITKLLIPLYEAELETDNFNPEIEQKFGIEYEWDKCYRCGSHYFYLRLAQSKQGLKDKIEQTVDIEKVCAECGSSEGGFIINDEFGKAITDKKKVKK